MKIAFLLSLILIFLLSITFIYSLSVQDLFIKISDIFKNPSSKPFFYIYGGTEDKIVINSNQGVGLCHWVSPEILSRDYISWAYESNSRWSTIEPSEGTFDFRSLDGSVATARNAGKKIWIELLTTEGSVPQWAKNKGIRIVDVTGGAPVPWDPIYKNLLAKVIDKLAEKYDNDPTVEAINIAAGGCYGEMNFMSSCNSPQWEANGYTNEVFVQTVKDSIDIYLGEYRMPDGTKNRGFKNKPVVLQLGSGLYGCRPCTTYPVVDYAMQKYGMRVWLKFNGWGGGWEPREIFQWYWNETRVGYEPAVPLKDSDFVKAMEDHSSYVCLQGAFLNDPSIIPKAKDLAKKIGSQIKLEEFTYPSRTNPGENIQINFKLKNEGITPLMRPKRVGIKDIVDSYEIFVDFVNITGHTVIHEKFIPTTPTNRWFTDQEIVETKTLNIPIIIQPGQYNIRVGIANPDDENQRIKLLNTEVKDSSDRYSMGWINIGGDWIIPPVTITSTTIPSALATTTTTTTTITSTTTGSTLTTTTTTRTTTTQIGSTTSIIPTTIPQLVCEDMTTCTECISRKCQWCEKPLIGSTGCKDSCSWSNCFQGTCMVACPSVTTTTSLNATTTTGVNTTTTTTANQLTTTTSEETTNTEFITTTLTSSVSTTLIYSTTSTYNTVTTTSEAITTTTISSSTKKSGGIKTIAAILGGVGIVIVVITLL